MYINDTLITATTATAEFRNIKLGDFWASANGISYFDDVSVCDTYGVNVALNKTIPGYSSQYNGTFFEASNINDGEVDAADRGWASVSGSGTRNEWVKIDYILFQVQGGRQLQQLCNCRRTVCFTDIRKTVLLGICD